MHSNEKTQNSTYESLTYLIPHAYLQMRNIFSHNQPPTSTLNVSQHATFMYLIKLTIFITFYYNKAQETITLPLWNSFASKHAAAWQEDDNNHE